MFNLKQAQQFTNELLCNVWPNVEIHRLSEFYHVDVVGHAKQETFGFKEIKDRMHALAENTEQRQFDILDLTIIDNLIIFQMYQQWMLQLNQESCESWVTGIYRIKQHKISEAWLLLDSETDGYRQSSADIVTHSAPFNVKSRQKKEFLKKLSCLEIELSSAEQDCLFYYLQGFSAKETAKLTDYSFRTVQAYIANVKEKYACYSKAELRAKIFS